MNLRNFKYLSIFFVLIISLSAGAAKKSVKAQTDPVTILEKGRKAFFDYDFETASEAYSDYRDLMQKKKTHPAEELEVWEQELEIAENAFNRVEKIIVIDSLSLPFDTFYKDYKLSAGTGKLIDAKSIDGLGVTP